MCTSCVGIGWVCFVVHVDMRRSPSVVISVEFGRIEVFGCISCVLVLSASFTEFLSSVFGSEVLWFSWMSCMGVVFSFVVCCRCTTSLVKRRKPGGEETSRFHLLHVVVLQHCLLGAADRLVCCLPSLC